MFCANGDVYVMLVIFCDVDLLHCYSEVHGRNNAQGKYIFSTKCTAMMVNFEEFFCGVITWLLTKYLTLYPIHSVLY